jgi:hypothetical protein
MPKTLNLIAYKTQSGIWAFDHEHNDTIAEALCNGTEYAIDWYYELMTKKQSKFEDKISFYLSTDKFNDAITKINLIKTDEFGSTYSDDLSGMSVWLCPWLQGYFGFVPDRIYVSCEVINEISEQELDDIIETLGINNLKDIFI